MSNGPPSPPEPDRPPPPPQSPPQYPPPPYPGYPQYPPYGQPPGYQARTYNGLAIASMVLGILWLYWVGSILALVFGYVAKRQIRERDQLGSGMATAGIVLGWVGVGTLSLMIVFLIIGAATGDFDGNLQVVRLAP